MIQPQPFKLVCPKCGYSKVVKPKSDALNPMDMMSKCPKCGEKMERSNTNVLDDILSLFK